MRLTIFTLSLLLLARLGALAQGTIACYNDANTAITNGLTGARVVEGATFKAALFYAADAASVPGEADLVQVGDAVAMGPGDGLFMSHNVQTPPSTPPGGPAYLQVRVWESAYGSNYAQAVAAPAMNGRPALRGGSPIFRMAATGDSTTVPPTIPASLTRNGLAGFTLTYPGMGTSPLLSITRSNLQAILTWTADPAYKLEVASNLGAGLWPEATNVVLINGDQRSVVLDLSGSQSFYRLHQR